ncbi:hypothetical protein GCM10011415_22830 [Salipiger pallidus]|uniref:Uncharacterized protein n=1 Tax=Salipiger pallidus TaxID=1775170 RepID=A0A8J3EHE1_9RHOB|nr:hypothetical protein [Salipiger pallidus]GGG73866.1 hypothetical protein GCM10011415_22830 [Salipiger pallidus]
MTKIKADMGLIRYSRGRTSDMGEEAHHDDQRARLDHAKAQLDEWNAQIDKLEAEMDRHSLEARKFYAKTLELMRYQRNEAEKHLTTARETSDDAWDDVKDRFEIAWTGIMDALHRASR